MSDVIIRAENVSKEYRLGAIGGGTLKGDLQSLYARLRGREDPNTKIGAESQIRNSRFLALDDVSFEVHEGDTLGIIGGNGAGKSTLLKLMSRVTMPTKGVIKVNGRIASMLEVGTGFHPELTGRENVYMNGAILGMTKAEVAKKFDEIVAFSEIEKFIDTPVKRYSSGMYVKLAFAVASHLDSEIMIMDEVLAVGDMQFQKKCFSKMSDTVNSDGRTILYVSHNMNTVRQLCNRCIVLKSGKIVYDGDTEHAIRLYLDSELCEEKTVVDLTALERPKFLKKRQKATLQQFSLINKNNCVFKKGESLDFNLRWKNDYDLDDLCIRAEITTPDDLAIGTAFLTHLGDFKEGTVVERDFRMDISSLAQGVYNLRIAIYQTNGYGSALSADFVYPAFTFKIDDEENPDIIWRHKGMGYIKLPDLELI